MDRRKNSRLMDNPLTFHASGFLVRTQGAWTAGAVARQREP